MSFLVQRTAGSGLSLTQIATAVLRIGRGTNQELRSENPAVALEHAIIEGDAAGYLITDKGSITGTYVNKKPVETSRLSKGDVIEIGDLRIEVQLADPAKPLFLRVVTARTAPSMLDDDEDVVVTPAVTPGARVVKSKKIDYVSAYRIARPYLTKLSITAVLLILALAVIGQIVEKNRQSTFMPGGVSTAHTRKLIAPGVTIADRCDVCHTPFKGVSSQKCMNTACHPQAPHAELESNPPECFDCHPEHRGAVKLADIPNQRCVDCHADLTRHVRVPRAQLASLRFAGGRYSFDDIAHIAEFNERHPDLVYPADTDTLRLKHKTHLNPSGVFNATGRREKLDCKSCHALVPNKDQLEPVAIDYETHCQRCHLLTFDPRFPTSQVPHGGNRDIVYGFVTSFAVDRDFLNKPPAEIRRILSARKFVAPDARAIVNAEQVFKTKCFKCHQLRTREGRIEVIAPVIRAQWITSVNFPHGRHTQTDCETCHRARQSVAPSDVLMPKLADCVACHGPGAKVSRAASACRTCHRYHLRLKRPLVTASFSPAGAGGLGREGRMLQGILLAVIVVLLLVVLVPVGIALFQRLRPEPAAPAPKEPAPIPPSTQKIPALRPDGPTDKVARQKEPPPPEPTPAPAPPPPSPPPPKAPEPAAPAAAAPRADQMPDRPTSLGAGTEMVLWYGLLNCTSGPLEGQRFVIEEEGFYIGRDPALSKVVIPDNRVSKRHVRIVPRDGKVWAIDQSSTNGTFLAGAAGQRITEVQLKRGDTLILGDNAATFVYQI